MPPLQLFDLLTLVQIIGLALARPMGMAIFLPFLGRQQVSGLVRTAVCLALSLPTAWMLWPSLVASPPSPVGTVMLGVKEALLGALLGMLTATPFWAVRGMGTLIDNQRGANAAQQANPALQADATLLGELSERALVALLIEYGLFQFVFTNLTDSYASWQVLDLLPTLDPAFREGLVHAMTHSVTNALILAAPALGLLMLVELGLALTSTAVQGFDVYASALAVKSIMSLVVLMLVAAPLFDHSVELSLTWWREGLPALIGKPP